MTDKPTKLQTPKPAKTVEELLQQIRNATETGEGNYIYRGEPREKYKDDEKEDAEISSNLYRVYAGGIGTDSPDIDEVQNKIISKAKEHTGEKDDDKILEQLQHYGGKTNQIDFTTDYLIALFFACDGYTQYDGRLIFLDKTKKNEKKFTIYNPANPQNRVIAQKSIFVRPPKGFIKPDRKITIPKTLKKLVLEYLIKHHNIKTATIYNDIHGYITQAKIKKSDYVSPAPQIQESRGGQARSSRQRLPQGKNRLPKKYENLRRPPKKSDS